MNVKEYIASGVLELYVSGALSNEENFEVSKNAEKYPEILKEIKAIEASILALSKEAYPITYTTNFKALKKKMDAEINSVEVVQHLSLIHI